MRSSKTEVDLGPSSSGVRLNSGFSVDGTIAASVVVVKVVESVVDVVVATVVVDGVVGGSVTGNNDTRST